MQSYWEVSSFAIGKAQRFGGSPFVIVYGIKRLDFDSFNRKYYGEPNAPYPDFEPDVNHYRSLSGFVTSGFDVVYGPTAVPGGEGWVVSDRYTKQFKFEAGGTKKLKPMFLLPADDGKRYA
jgi:hypothetical protein